MRVLGAPVREHDYGVNPALECSDIGGDPLEVRAIQRSSTWWHVQPIGAWPGSGGGRRLTDGVDGNEANPYAISLDDHWTTGCLQISPSAYGLDLA